jgi:hypothetical protein
MSVTHIHLILLNVTTVEQMKIRDMKEDESAMLAETYSMCAFAKKRQARARWDEEWGRPAFEGNIWWLGTRRKNWESVMGQSMWSWFRELHHLILLIPLSANHTPRMLSPSWKGRERWSELPNQPTVRRPGSVAQASRMANALEVMPLYYLTVDLCCPCTLESHVGSLLFCIYEQFYMLANELYYVSSEMRIARVD